MPQPATHEPGFYMIALLIVLLILAAAVAGWFLYNQSQRRGKVLISPPERPSRQPGTETNGEEQP